jgi:DNA-binding NarL/FixJ family response regulator
MPSTTSRRVLAVIPDLFFATKVAATAKASGIELELASPALAAQRVAAAPPALVILDLHAGEAVALVSALRTVAPDVPVVGFYSHVETALRRDALAAGIAAALPRSAFVHRLAALLTHGLAALHETAPGGSEA